MQTIITKYHGPTNTKPARISAKASGIDGVKRFSFDHGVSVDDNHKQAATALKTALKWTGYPMYGGSLDSGTMVWVFSAPWTKID